MKTSKTIESPAPAARRSGPPRTLVVATDFSDRAAQAVDWAARLATVHGAQMVVVHAVDTDLPALAEAQGPIGMHVRRELEALGKRLAAARVPAQTEYDMGKPWSVIAAVAEKARADLIVVGAHGRGRVSEHVLGTVAARLIRTTSTPVVVHRAGNASAIRTVLVATDFSEESALAAKTAAGLLPASGEPGRIVLFHAVSLPVEYADVRVPSLAGHWAEAERSAAAQLEGMARELRSDRLQVETRSVRGDPAAEIVQAAVSMHADLIALGTVGRSGMRRLFMGSVAERVLHRAPCAVLAVRKPGTAEADAPEHERPGRADAHLNV